MIGRLAYRDQRQSLQPSAGVPSHTTTGFEPREFTAQFDREGTPSEIITLSPLLSIRRAHELKGAASVILKMG